MYMFVKMNNIIDRAVEAARAAYASKFVIITLHYI